MSTTDYKQIAFKLQDDINSLKWDQANRDLPFLKEIKKRFEDYQKSSDITQFEYAMTMLGDWIVELEKIIYEQH